MNLHIGANSLIGDSILIEPALSAYNIQTGDSVNLHVQNPIRGLFEHHPHINLTDTRAEDSRELSCGKAFGKAAGKGWYFAQGFFEQVGLEPDRFRSHFKIFGPPFDEERISVPIVCIAPFSVSCSVHNTGVANKTVPLSWWEPIIEGSPLPIVSLGSAKDPLVPGTINMRGKDLRSVVALLRSCRVFVSVETGLLHLSAAVCRKVIYLNSATPISLCAPGKETQTVTHRTSRPEQWHAPSVLGDLKSLV